MIASTKAPSCRRGDRFSVLDYLDRLDAYGYSPGSDLSQAPHVDAAGIPGLARRVVPPPLRPRVKTWATGAVRLPARRRAARLLSSTPDLKLHLGCGPTHLRGWVNVDLAGTRADLAWDLRRPLPFPDGSVVAIFHEHLLEHLPWRHAASFLAVCGRLLRPGGVLRIGVPDFGRAARDYAHGGSEVDRIRPARPTALLGLAELIFCYEHRSVWDADTLVALITELGFVDAAERRAGQSRLDPAPDTSHRAAETLYVEALKVST